MIAAFSEVSRAAFLGCLLPRVGYAMGIGAGGLLLNVASLSLTRIVIAA